MVGKSGSCYDSILPPKNSASYLAALPILETQNDYYATAKRPPPVGLYEGRLAPLWPPLTLLETEDYCEITKKKLFYPA